MSDRRHERVDCNLDVAGGSLHGVVKPQCACVHHDAYECARIRDGRHMPDEDDYHKRCCECDCHETEDFYEEEY